MRFEKGNQYAKLKGKHQKTKEWEQLGEAIISRHAKRFNQILDDADDELFAKHFTGIIEYFQPKLQRSEVNQTTTLDLSLLTQDELDLVTSLTEKLEQG